MEKIAFTAIVRKIGKVKFPKVDLVVGIRTGGIVPAALVAYRLSKELMFLDINYRDIKNKPRYERPRLLSALRLPRGVRKILLVDDVAVTGQTLQAAKDVFKSCQVVTFVLKGKADIVLFPTVKDCVDWPWKRLSR
jgi:hypoxanthine phosphoribosyltransferase